MPYNNAFLINKLSIIIFSIMFIIPLYFKYILIYILMLIRDTN